MTPTERRIADALLECSILPASFDKVFIRQLPAWFDQQMTEQGHITLIRLMHKYRRQIPNYNDLCLELNPDNFEIHLTGSGFFITRINPFL
jgi:hypothetical protein